MLVRFLCPACHQLLGTAARKAGAQVNCPKCGATILVPDPQEPAPAESLDPPAVPGPATKDLSAAGAASGASDAPETTPADAIGFDVLGDLTAYDRPASGVSTSVAPSKRPPALDLPLDDGDRIVISRRVIYFQAVLLAVVGLVALAAGYLIGSGARLHGP
jgi:hypothetical protein